MYPNPSIKHYGPGDRQGSLRSPNRVQLLREPPLSESFAPGESSAETRAEGTGGVERMLLEPDGECRYLLSLGKASVAPQTFQPSNPTEAAQQFLCLLLHDFAPADWILLEWCHDFALLCRQLSHRCMACRRDFADRELGRLPTFDLAEER